MKLSSMAILLVAVGAMMIPAMPDAMAMPDVSSGCFDSPVLAGLDCEIRVTANGKSDVQQLRVYESDGANTNPDDNDSGNQSACPLPNDDTSLSVWELRNTGDSAAIKAFLPQGSTMKVVFKDGTVTVTVPPGSGLTTNGDLPVASDPDSVSAKWIDQNAPITPAATDTLTPPDIYFILACGEDILSQSRVNYQSSNLFENQAPVGGELLQINTAALLVAGISTGSFWMVPIIGAVAVAGYGVYRLSTKKHI